MEFVDQTLTCSACGHPFILTGAQQAFREDYGFRLPRTLCATCLPAVPKHGLRPYDGTRPPRPHRDRHVVPCAVCAAPVLVSFAPRQGRPVYCGACFRTVRFSPDPARSLVATV